LLLNFRIIWF